MRPLLPLPLLALLLTAAAWVAESGSAGPRSRSANADSGTVAKLNATRVYVNGLPLREEAIVKDGVTYVPLRAVAESLGCTVDYDPKAGVFIWGGQSLRDGVANPNGMAEPQNPTPGLPTLGLPRDPRPILPQPPTPGRP